MHCVHPPPSWLNSQQIMEEAFHQHLTPKTVDLHPIISRTSVQFPEARLIQYDCGMYYLYIAVQA